MNRRVVRWLKDLRSGNYKQGRHALVDINEDEKTFCCLGVYASGCKSYKLDKVGCSFWKGAKHYTSDIDSEDFKLMGFKLSIPVSIFDRRTKLGKVIIRESIDGLINVSHVFIYLNDELNYSFNKIADFIERYYPLMKA